MGSAESRAFECPLAPEVARNINTRSVYIDKQASIADPKQEARNRKIRAPIDQFQKDINRIADDYYRQPSREKLECGQRYLEKWASGRALLGPKVSGNGALVRFWAAGTIGIAVLKLGLNDTNSSPVLWNWLRDLGAEVEEFINQRKRESNLYYWSGYSLGVMGLVLDDKSYQDRSRDIFLSSLRDIEADGTLPLELRRGQRAAIYHAFAAQAIFGLALLHNANFEELNKGPFGRLVELLKATATDPSYIANKVGVKQMRISEPGWISLYDSLVAGTSAADVIDRGNVRCPQILRLGGDLCQLTIMRSGATPVHR
ncbi:alginate lyase family protein [Bordetella genomosp. 4]|uniref:alginate lyase family protein n=1 Tax=Bordetella genomosp. 4 TaxID=463044 RepID=UPI0015C63A48|nr:alginate lyase family protein [Bordetella genomosp. 4]